MCMEVLRCCPCTWWRPDKPKCCNHINILAVSKGSVRKFFSLFLSCIFLRLTCHTFRYTEVCFFLLSVYCIHWHIWKTQEEDPFLRWNASRCEQIHQCLSPTEILRWWMDLMDWFKPRLPSLTDWITEWMLEQITSAGGECIYTVHFLHSRVHPSLRLIVRLGSLKVIVYTLLFPNREGIWHQYYQITLFIFTSIPQRIFPWALVPVTDYEVCIVLHRTITCCL